MAEDKRPVKVVLLVRRNPKMTEEEFHHHWTVKHPPIVNDWLQKYGITRYVQYHTPSSERAKGQEELPSFGGAIKNMMLDYDGFVELLMPSAKCWDRAREDPYYKKVVQPDEETFADMGNCALLIGYEELKFQS